MQRRGEGYAVSGPTASPVILRRVNDLPPFSCSVCCCCCATFVTVEATGLNSVKSNMQAVIRFSTRNLPLPPPPVVWQYSGKLPFGLAFAAQLVPKWQHGIRGKARAALGMPDNPGFFSFAATKAMPSSGVADSRGLKL